MGTALIILAAGQGTRMKSDLPKVLHPVAGVPLLIHAMAVGRVLNPDHMIVVTGHGAEDVARTATAYDETVRIARQDRQLGTAHAVAQAAPLLDGYDGDAIVLYGDTPFISAETLHRMAGARAHHDLVVLGFEPEDPGRYGRLVMQGDMLEQIVEFKDATARERAIGFCNSGVMMAPAPLLFDLVAQIGNDNAGGEYYLTDIVALARGRGLAATAITCDAAETMGVNSRAELAMAEAAFQARARAAALENGVTLVAPDSVHFAHDTVAGRDCVIEQNVVFGPGVTIESGSHIRAFSHLEGCHVARGAVVGPYARLRPGAELSENAHVGNFVEVKNATLGEGSKANHLSYLGDAGVGAGTNIGAGTITCNYDGVSKHRTEIGDNAFIGSNTMLIAPVRLGHGAMTGSGSVITRDVPDGALAIARAEQVTKPGFAHKMVELLKSKARNRDEGED